MVTIEARTAPSGELGNIQGGSQAGLDVARAKGRPVAEQAAGHEGGDPGPRPSGRLVPRSGGPWG